MKHVCIYIIYTYIYKNYFPCIHQKLLCYFENFCSVIHLTEHPDDQWYKLLLKGISKQTLNFAVLFFLSLCQCLNLLHTRKIINLNFILPSSARLVKNTLFLFRKIFFNINFFSEIPQNIWPKLIVATLQLVHYNLPHRTIVIVLQFVQVFEKPSSGNTRHLQPANLKYKLLKLSYMSWFRFSNLVRKYVIFFLKNFLIIKNRSEYVTNNPI